MKPETLFKMCVGKWAYGSWAKAERARKRRQSQGAGYLRSYHCENCLKFHLTSKPLPGEVRPALPAPSLPVAKDVPRCDAKDTRSFSPGESSPNPRFIAPIIPEVRKRYEATIEVRNHTDHAIFKSKLEPFLQLAKRKYPELNLKKQRIKAKNMMAKADSPAGWKLRQQVLELRAEGLI